jgi:cytochrome c556
MRIKGSLTAVSLLALCAAILAVPTVALTDDHEPSPEDVAIDHRRTFMQLVWRDFGPLGAMAKGEMEYDADAAQAHANNLRALSSYNPTNLFMANTSNADRPGDTRALPAIWENLGGFLEDYGTFANAMSALADAAGQGHGELAAAVGEAGKSCGGCHDDFRAKDF